MHLSTKGRQGFLEEELRLILVLVTLAYSPSVIASQGRALGWGWGWGLVLHTVFQDYSETHNHAVFNSEWYLTKETYILIRLIRGVF